MKAPFLIGRLLFGGYFLYNGINHLVHREQLGQYAGAKGVPAPKAAVAISGVPLLIGGASLLLGLKPKYGALAILGFLAGVSPVMHDFWNSEDPNARMADMINFTKNMALAGGALALMGVDEPWESSVPVARPSLVKRMRAAGRKLAA
ncbi:MAG TPA: DoxX family protein [Terriglobales bacterium]|nr:DoxX family protein [Terriglobales bacterium]